MDTLQRHVRQAYRRLLLQRFLRLAPWMLFAWLVLAAAVLAVPKVYALPAEHGLSVLSDPHAGWVWKGAWFGGALALGLASAALGTWWRRGSVLDAAIEIDRRCALKERVSSCLQLTPEELDSEAGRALLADAARKLERVDLGESFRPSTDWRAALPLAPVVVALVLALWVPNALLEREAQGKQAAAEEQVQVKRSAEELKKRILAKRKELEEKGDLQDAENLLREMEEQLEKFASKERADRKEAMIELNDMAKSLQKRREEIAGNEQVRKQLDKLKQLEQNGPAKKMADAMQQGDFKQALQETKELQDQLRNGELTEEQKAALAEQLEAIKKQLEEVAAAHEQAKRELEEQIKQAEQAGDRQRAGELQQQLGQLQAQDPQMRQLQQLAEKMGACQECLKQGDAAQGADQLQQLAENLQDMVKQQAELETLDDLLDQLAQAKSGMNCEACQGAGCEACQGGGEGQGEGDKAGAGAGQGDGLGDGLGEGQGFGRRPEEETDSGFFEARVRGEVQRGAAVRTGDADGANVAGQARESIKTQVESVRSGNADPFVDQQVPKAYREQVRQYFDSFREGK